MDQVQEVEALVKFWQDFKHVHDQLQVHEEDRRFLDNSRRCRRNGTYEVCASVEFDGYVDHPRLFSPKHSGFHFSLTPIPYVGDLRNSEVVVLMLNPSLDYTCYFAEQHDGFREVLQANLRQESFDPSYPFFCLNPHYCWYGGFQYWELRVRQMVLDMVKSKVGTAYKDCLEKMAKRFAVLQVIPYTSWHFTKEWLIDGKRKSQILPSAQHAFAAARALAKDPRRKIIVIRSNKYWQIRERDGVVIQKSGRSGYFSREARDLLLQAWRL